MTQHRDITSLLDVWLSEGSTAAPDRVIDIVTDRIERQGQRGAWRFSTREFRRPSLLRLAAVPAALAILGAGLVYLAGSPAPEHSLAPQTPFPSPTAPPHVGPSASPYILPSGLPYPPARTLTTTDFRPAFRMELPVGWEVSETPTSVGMALGLIRSESGDSGHIGGSIALRANPVLGDAASCPEDRTAPPTPGPVMPASSVVAALLVDPRFEVTAGPEITIDGRSANVLDVRLAPGAPGTCIGGARLLERPGSFVVLEGEERVRVILLDVDDVPLFILIWPLEEAFDAFVARAMLLIDGLTFLP